MALKTLIFLFLSSLFWCFAAFAQDTTIYIYYYSDQHQAFVVERTEGGDTRLVMSVPGEAGSEFVGPGWSPNGQWFAWLRLAPKEGLPDAAVVNPSTRQSLESLVDEYNSAAEMVWSPNSHLLLVAHKNCTPVISCIYNTYWLIDVQEGLVLASFVFAPEAGGVGYAAPFEWLPDDSGVMFYGIDALAGHVSPRTRITMHSDGRVLREPLTVEEWSSIYVRLPLEGDDLGHQFASPQGRYLVEQGAITDTETGVSHPLHTGSWSEREVGYLDGVKWHPSEEWALLTFRRGEGYFVTVLFKTDGTYQRELCTCYPGPNLVGWLPDNVDVDSIPLLGDAP